MEKENIKRKKRVNGGKVIQEEGTAEIFSEFKKKYDSGTQKNSSRISKKKFVYV